MKYLELYETFSEKPIVKITNRIKDCFLELQDDGFIIDTSYGGGKFGDYQIYINISKHENGDDLELVDHDVYKLFKLSDVIDQLIFSISYGSEFGLDLKNINVYLLDGAYYEDFVFDTLEGLKSSVSKIVKQDGISTIIHTISINFKFKSTQHNIIESKKFIPEDSTKIEQDINDICIDIKDEGFYVFVGKFKSYEVYNSDGVGGVSNRDGDFSISKNEDPGHSTVLLGLKYILFDGSQIIDTLERFYYFASQIGWDIRYEFKIYNPNKYVYEHFHPTESNIEKVLKSIEGLKKISKIDIHLKKSDEF